MRSHAQRHYSEGMTAFDPRWDGTSIPEKHWHFHRRLHERYGIVMVPGDFGAMVKAIKSGKALMVRKQDRGRRIYWCKVPSCYERIYVLARRDAIFAAWPATPDIIKDRKRAQARLEAERAKGF